MSSELLEQVRTFILDNYLFTDDKAALGIEESLLDKGVVDSTGMLEIIMFIEDELGVSVEDEEMIPENLDSVKRIADFVERKRSN